jgi:hypothetical protein
MSGPRLVFTVDATIGLVTAADLARIEAHVTAANADVATLSTLDPLRVYSGSTARCAMEYFEASPSLDRRGQQVARVIVAASITVPLDGRTLDSNGIVGDETLSGAPRSAIDALVLAAPEARRASGRA